MCGITGWIDYEADLTASLPTLARMVRTLEHRGPDDVGTWLAPHAALGHRRLSVVDPAGGGQPMVRRRGGDIYAIVYNGELYNTPDLRRELESRGHAFFTHSDTEVLLVSFIEWGESCVEKLNGIFAFGIWNESDQSLFMARDRLGVKPLFYAQRGKAFLFGSEVKAMLAHPAVAAEVDAEGLADLFTLGPARTPGHGIYRNISELRPGYALTCNRDGLRVRQYWALQSAPHLDDTDTTAEKIASLLRDTVERQLVADVPVCTLLSGGVDSSALTAFAAGAFARDGQGPLHTYSIDYVGNDVNFKPNAFQPNSDASFVRLVSERLGTVHHRVLIDTPQLVEALRDAMRACDRPGMADVDSSLLLFCREIKRGATVALSGESADEIFGGYPWFRSEELLNSGTFPWTRLVRERARLLKPEIAERMDAENYVAERFHDALAEVPRLPGEPASEASRRAMFYLNITRFMPTLLDRKDRMSMACGLEVRVPFCDHRLVEYVWNIPWDMKTCDGMEKGILRRALRGVLPEEVLTRKKSPYPKTHNPAYAAAVKGWLSEIMADPASPLLDIVDTDAVRSLIESDGAAFSPAWFGQLMGGPQLMAYLAQVDTWLREYHVALV